MEDNQNNGSNTNTGNEGNGGSGATGGSGQDKSPKTFTQEEVNSLIARETKKTQEKFLKDIGFTDFKSANEGMKQYREYLDNTKTEQQKSTELIKSLQTELDTLKKSNTVSSLELKVLKAGINPEYASDFTILLMNSGIDDTDKAIESLKVKHKYMFIQSDSKDTEDKKEKKGTGTPANRNNTTSNEKTNAFRARMGLKPI